jgi:hypothetical protein
MKKIILCFFLISFSIISFSKSNISKLTKNEKVSTLLKGSHIDYTFTSGGYTIHVVGDFTFNPWNGNYSFNGTVSINGNGVHINNLPVSIKGDAYRVSSSLGEVDEILNSNTEIPMKIYLKITSINK